jgi:hypothetical protein
MSRRSLILSALGGGLAVALLISLLTAPSADDFATQFAEVAHYRNENNTGPVRRVYVVTASQVNEEEMLAYAQLQPHSKYGITTVYFFSPEAPFPTELAPQKPHFPMRFRAYCLGRYRKLALGQERFERQPISW